MNHSRIALAALMALSFATVRAQQTKPVQWESPAQFHPFLKKKIPGTLVLTADAVEFRSPKFSRQWPYREIKTFDLRQNGELILTSYENRRWHEPGEKKFRFTLAKSMPPEVANDFASRVARPVINGAPGPTSAAFTTLPAHQRGRFGGSNGTLRFRQTGIDYLATDARSSRTWRWSDIQTIANPNPWDFRVTGYREILEFDLKQPMQRELFDRLWNILYAADLNPAPSTEGHRQ